MWRGSSEVGAGAAGDACQAGVGGVALEVGGHHRDALLDQGGVAVGGVLVGQLEDPVADLHGEGGRVEREVLAAQAALEGEAAQHVGDPHVVSASEPCDGDVGATPEVDLDERGPATVDGHEGLHRGAHDGGDAQHGEGRDVLGDLGVHLLHVAPGEREEDGLLVPEVLVERGDRHLRLRGDGPRGERLHALGEDQPLGGVEDGLHALAAALLAGDATHGTRDRVGGGLVGRLGGTRGRHSDLRLSSFHRHVSECRVPILKLTHVHVSTIGAP